MSQKENEWEIISADYSKLARTYKNKILEVEKYGNEINLSVYKLQNGMYGIFVDYKDNISGIIYVTKDEVYRIKEEIKKELENEYRKENKNSNEFSNYFNNKYNVQEIPLDFLDKCSENDETDLNIKKICCVSNNARIIFWLSLVLVAFIALNFLAGEAINIILMILLIIIYIVLLLRIINFELLIENKKIFYRNLFRREFEYSLSDVKFYKIFNEGTNSRILSLFLNKKIIWLFEFDSAFEQVIDYLKDNKIKKVKMKG